MKIAFVINDLKGGGAERVMSQLCNHFATQGHDVKLILMTGETLFYHLCAEVEIIKNPKPKGIIGQVLFLKRNLEGSDVSISFTTRINCLNIIACLGAKTKSVISERTNHRNKNVSQRWRALRGLYCFSEALIVLSSYDFKYYKRFVRNVSIVTNSFEPSLSREADRENIILNVGRLVEVKNQIYLIKAFNFCVKKLGLRGWKLVLVGEGNERGRLESYVEALKLGQEVEIVGQKSNVELFYNRAKIYCLTSKHEGFPNSLLEAYCSGCACISLDIKTGPSEILRNNEDGVLLDKRASYTDFGQHLMRLIQNPKLIEKFYKNSIRNSERFRPKAKLRQWEKIVEKTKA